MALPSADRTSRGFAKPAIIMLSAAIVGGGCDYLFQIFMGRSLGPEAYSELNALLSLFYIVSVPSQSISNFLVRYVSRYKVQGREGQLAWLVRKTLILTAVLSVAMALVVLLLSPSISRFISLTTMIPLILIGLGIVVALVSIVGYGTAQGLQRFRVNAAFQLTNQGLKLILGAGLVVAGFGVTGAIGGVVVGSLFGLALALYSVRDCLTRPTERIERKEIQEIWRYLMIATAAVVGYGVLINVDLFLARQYLSSEQAGLYASALVLSKVLLYLPGSVGFVLMSKLSEYHALGVGAASLLRRVVLWTMLLSMVLLAFYLIIPEQILVFFYGYQYADAAGALMLLAIAMTFYGLCGLFLNYALATADKVQVGLFCFFAVFEVVLIMLYHPTPEGIALDILVTAGFLLLVSVGYMEARNHAAAKAPA